MRTAAYLTELDKELGQSGVNIAYNKLLYGLMRLSYSTAEHSHNKDGYLRIPADKILKIRSIYAQDLSILHCLCEDSPHLTVANLCKAEKILWLTEPVYDLLSTLREVIDFNPAA